MSYRSPYKFANGNAKISVMRDLYKSANDQVAGYWCLVFSADGKFLATGESDGDVKVAFSKVVNYLDITVLDMDIFTKAC